MSKNTRMITFLLGAAALTFLQAGVVRASDDQLDAATKARIARFEKGPTTINVSKYPQEIQDRYQLFRQKCSQCHKLSRPINSDYATPEEWSRYIKRMMHKPGSGISGSQAKKIYEFLVYDASIRKKKMLDDKLAKMSADQRKEAEAKIKEVRDKFDKN